MTSGQVATTRIGCVPWQRVMIGRSSRQKIPAPNCGRRRTCRSAGCMCARVPRSTCASRGSGSMHRAVCTRTGCGITIRQRGGICRPIRWGWSMGRVSMAMRGRTREAGWIRGGGNWTKGNDKGSRHGIQGQDSFSFHSQNMTVAARAIAERKTFGHLSYRVATLRQSFSLPNMISIRLRRL